MIRRISLVGFFLLAIFIVLGVARKPVLAADYGVVTVELNNSAGTIPITVTVLFYDNGTSGSPGTGSVFSTKRPTLAAGERRTIVSDMDDPDAPFYSISWSTDCTDPPAAASYLGTWGDATQSVNQYDAPSQDVHCRTPNATPYITNTACASVGWTLTGVGENGANIEEFWIYRSTNSGDLSGDPSLSFRTDIVGSSSRSKSWSLSDNTYYVRIRAVSWQGVGSWSSIGSFTCSSVVLSAASGLNAGPYCNGSSDNLADNIVNVDFGWARSTPTPSDGQWLDYSLVNDNFTAGWPYQGNSNVGTAASSKLLTGFAQGRTYYWRINNLYGANWYPSVTGRFTTPTCPPNTSPTPTPGPVCPAGCR